MPCWHVGPCGVGCDGYTANPQPMPPTSTPIIIMPPPAPLMAFEVREMIERLQRENIELQRQKAVQYDEFHKRLADADHAYRDERDKVKALELQNRALEARIEILSRKPLDTGLAHEEWRDGEHCRCNFDPNSDRVRGVCQFHETIYKEWAQAKDKVEETNRLNRAWEEAINSWCSCGGRSPNDAGVCAACRIYHHAKGIEAPHITDQRNSEKRNDEAVDCSHCSNGGKCECTGEVGPCCHCS